VIKFELEAGLRGAPDVEVLEDMRWCVKLVGKDTITMDEYADVGKAHPSLISRRFGSWPNALKLAGLKPSRSKIGITDDERFENV
jgi:Homing endonuclease associated repeat